MKIGIMQPYFFPYIGYFQLIDAVDVYVNLDHVSFMKRSYMTRNKIANNISVNVPVIGGSQNKSCVEVKVGVDQKYIDKLLKTLHFTYSKEKNYKEILSKVIGNIPVDVSISEFNLHFIKNICNYLDIKTKIVNTSEGLTNKKKGEGLKEITKKFEGNEYINAIGGMKLYNKENFKKDEIDLKFIKMKEVDFDNPYSSILDLLFRYDKEHIKEQIKKYELI